MEREILSITNVRGVDAALWHRLRVECARRRVSIATVLNELIRAWLAREEAKP